MTKGQILQSKVFEIGQLVDKDVDVSSEIRKLQSEGQKTKSLIRQKLKEAVDFLYVK